jgi:hypothetical protein
MGSVRLDLTEEYRENAISLVAEDGRTIADVALIIGGQTANPWDAGRGKPDKPSQLKPS